MFNQTFVDGTQKTSKPVTVLISTLAQLALLGVLILIPVIYTAALPSAALRNLLWAPPLPPAPHVQTKAPLAQAHYTARIFRPQLVAPKVIRDRINPMTQTVSAPDIGVGASNDPADGLVDAVTSVIGSTSDALPKPEPPTPQKPPAKSGPLKVSTGVAEANLLQRVIPSYPPLAKSARIQGVVEFSATISKAGRIENLRLVRGHPLLVKAAEEAVLQWRYKPTLLNGEPVEVVTSVLVNFTLTQ